MRRFFEVNALSTFVCCQHAGSIMAEQEQGGAIVNHRRLGRRPALSQLQRVFHVQGHDSDDDANVRREFAPKVRVNAVLPGPVLLPEGVSEAERRRAIAGTLLGRPGRPENVAHAVAFLLENDFVTGVCLPVDGGRTLGETG